MRRALLMPVLIMQRASTSLDMTRKASTRKASPRRASTGENQGQHQPLTWAPVGSSVLLHLHSNENCHLSNLAVYWAKVCKFLKGTPFPLLLCVRERRRKGFDRFGFNRDGFNDAGFDRFGFDKDGYDKSGFGEWFGR